MGNNRKLKDHKTNYGFFGRLHENFPSQIIVDITDVCNLACIHCPHPEFKKTEHYGAQYLDPKLNSKMVSEVREFGQNITQYIRYTSNGEPLVHPKAYDMLDEAVSRSGVYVALTTNGTIMNEKRTRKLLDSGLHMIDISIDAASDATYSKVRVNGDFETTKNNVLRLLKWVKEHNVDTKVVVSFVEQPQNTHEKTEFQKFWNEAGVDYVVIRKLHSHSGAKDMVATVNWEKLQNTKRRPCLYPWERITLNARGDLSFCPSDWEHGSRITSYQNSMIKDIWSDEFYKNLRSAHINCDFGNHSFCGNCSDWSLTQWPGEGRSYADMIEEFISERDTKT